MAAPAHTVLGNGLQTRPGPSLLPGPGHGRGDDSETNPHPAAEGSARALLARGPSARSARPRCRPGQGARPRRQSPSAGNQPCCHSPSSRGCERVHPVRPCQGRPATSRRVSRVCAWPHGDDRPSPGDVRAMHPYKGKSSPASASVNCAGGQGDTPSLGPAAGGRNRPGSAPAGRSPGSASRWPADPAMPEIGPVAPAWTRRARRNRGRQARQAQNQPRPLAALTCADGIHLPGRSYESEEV